MRLDWSSSLAFMGWLSDLRQSWVLKENSWFLMIMIWIRKCSTSLLLLINNWFLVIVFIWCKTRDILSTLEFGTGHTDSTKSGHFRTRRSLGPSALSRDLGTSKLVWSLKLPIKIKEIICIMISNILTKIVSDRFYSSLFIEFVT